MNSLNCRNIIFNLIIVINIEGKYIFDIIIRDLINKKEYSMEYLKILKYN